MNSLIFSKEVVLIYIDIFSFFFFLFGTEDKDRLTDKISIKRFLLLIQFQKGFYQTGMFFLQCFLIVLALLKKGHWQEILHILWDAFFSWRTPNNAYSFNFQYPAVFALIFHSFLSSPPLGHMTLQYIIVLSSDLFKIMCREGLINHQMKAEHCLWEELGYQTTSTQFWENPLCSFQKYYQDL